MPDGVDQQAAAMLREHGLRVTGPRVAVLAAMLRRGHPVAASDLIDDVVDFQLSEVTVYRNLNRLAETGMLRRVDTTERRRRFEVAGAHNGHEHDHAHFVCDGCGTVTCLEAAVEPLEHMPLPAGFRVETQRVVLHGRCDTCD